MLTVNHLLALSNPALVSALSKKSFSSVNWPVLAWSAFRSTSGCAMDLSEIPDATPAQLPFPDNNLVRVDAKLLRQFCQSLAARHCRHCHFGLESR